MKLSSKILAVAFVVAIALTVTTVVGAAGFNTNLTVGSTGADVTALQTTLVSGGYLTMPAGVSMGYFGSFTKSAVMAFQTANGIPSTGFVGPLTRAALNAAPVGVSTVGGCAAGAAFSSTTGAPCTTTTTTTVPGCAAGAAFSATTGASCTNSAVVSQNGTDGTLTAAQSSYVSSGIQLKKGDTKNVVAETLKASVGPVTVTRTGVHFNQRPWLLFSQVTLSDSTGKLLATVPMTGAGSATEITVGSDYLVAFPAINETITPGQNTDLIVGVTVLPATDKITNGMSVEAAFDTMRTINGIGWTDTISAATLSATAGVGNNVFTLTSTGSVADIYTSISQNTPPTKQIPTSLTQTTNNVVLGTFSLKSANDSSTLNTLTATLASTSLQAGAGGVSGPTSAFSNVRIYAATGNCTLANPCGGTLNNLGVVTFSNLTIPLAQDTWTDLTVEADVTASTTGAGITLALNGASGIVATDANYGLTTYESGTATSNAITLTVNAVLVSNASVTYGNAVTSVVSGVSQTTGQQVTYTFTLNNTSNNALYVSATTTSFLGTTTTGITGSSSLATLVSPSAVSNSPMSGDVANVDYVIPQNSSRTFTIAGVIGGPHPSVGINMAIGTIYYGIAAADGSNHALSTSYGLSSLVASGSF